MADNWGADFWGAFSDVSKARMAQRLAEQQMAGRAAFGRALQDPNIFLPNGGGGQAPQAMPQGGDSAGPSPIGSLGQVYQGFQQRGLDPIHAAALAGNYRQESGGNPAAWNPKEGAGGLDQWRGPRLAALQRFAASQGKDWRDQNVQMDYAMQEGKTTEAGPWNKFLAAKDLPSANAALKSFIRYGDDSQGQRLKYAQQFLGGPQGVQQVAQQASALGGGAPAGQMSWQHIVQAIVAKNPNIDPGVLSQAVELFQPLMSQQSQADWREQSLQLRELALQLNEQKAATQADQGQQRINQGQERVDQAAQKEAGIQKRFDASNDMRLKGLQQKADEFDRRFKQAQTKADRDWAGRQLKANADQYHQRVMELIQRGSSMQGAPMDPAEQKKAIDEETARYNRTKAEIEQKISGGDNAAPAGSQAVKRGGQSDVQSGAVYSPGKDTVKYSDVDTLRNDINSGKVKPGSLAPGANGWKMFKGGNPKDMNNWVDVNVQE